MFFGTPRQVCEQLRAFTDRVDPIGHLLMQMGGYATQEDTVDSLTLIAEQLTPPLEEFLPMSHPG